MKTNTILFVTIAILLAIVIYLLLNTPVQTAVSREYVPVIYEDRRPRDTVFVGRWGGWGGWGFPTKPWGGHHPPPPPPPSPPTPPPAPPSPPPAEPPVEAPSGFLDMKKQEKEGFSSSAASYPFA